MKKFELVILESPYKGSTREIMRNIAYARHAMHDCLMRNEAPMASHMLYTQPGVLDDDMLEQRRYGIEAGLAWRKVAKKTVVYCDLGISTGMQYGIDAAKKSGNKVVYRKMNKQGDFVSSVISPITGKK